MAAPQPVTLVAVAEQDYTGPAPKPLAVVGGVPAGAVTAADITDATAVGRNVLKAADAAAARLAIGAGTSSVTLPATATAAELQAGTVTQTRLVTPKLIHDEIARQIAAIPAA